MISRALLRCTRRVSTRALMHSRKAHSLTMGTQNLDPQLVPETLVHLDKVEFDQHYPNAALSSARLDSLLEKGLKMRAADFPEMLLSSTRPLIVPQCIGVSGGADSLASCLWLRDECQRLNQDQTLVHSLFPGAQRPLQLRPVAITVDHGLRAESAAEAQYVARTQAQHRVSCLRASVVWNRMATPVVDRTMQLCECYNAAPSATAARNARYGLFLRVCHNLSMLRQDQLPELLDEEVLSVAPLLILGHHQYDQEETVLLRLAKESGLAGLAGMLAVVPLQALQSDVTMRVTYDSVVLPPVGSAYTKTSMRSTPTPTLLAVRPLLNVPKEAFLRHLTHKQVPWIEDPTNHKLQSDRVRVRRLLSRLRSHFGPAFVSRSVEQLQKNASQWDLNLRSFLQSHCIYSSLGVATLRLCADHPLMLFAQCRTITVVADKGLQLNIEKGVQLLGEIETQVALPESQRDVLSSSSCSISVIGNGDQVWLEIYQNYSNHSLLTPSICNGILVRNATSSQQTSVVTKNKVSSMRKQNQFQSIAPFSHKSHLDARVGVFTSKDPTIITTMCVRPIYAYRWQWWTTNK